MVLGTGSPSDVVMGTGCSSVVLPTAASSCVVVPDIIPSLPVTAAAGYPEPTEGVMYGVTERVPVLIGERFVDFPEMTTDFRSPEAAVTAMCVGFDERAARVLGEAGMKSVL